MTDHEILMELHLRMYTLEKTCENLSAQAFTERQQLLRANRMQGETIIRLLRAKESLLEALGRIAFGQQVAGNDKPIVDLRPLSAGLRDIGAEPLDDQTAVDIARALREMGH
jgi:hypothetical protein